MDELNSIKEEIQSNKKVRIAINGFGRIGRMIFRAGFDDPNIEFVAINDLGGPEAAKYYLKYDTVRGIFPYDIKVDGDYLVVNDKRIKVLQERDINNLPWGELGVDVVAECTGVYRDKEKAELHLKQGAKKVVISAPGHGDVFFFVRGVNDNEYNKDIHHVVSNGSCTTNSMTAIVNEIFKKYGIEKGFFSTVHAVTNDQRILDANHHKDVRRGRAGPFNTVPTTSGAAYSVVKLIPELQGRFDGMAFRVPVPSGSVTDLVLELKTIVTKDEINNFMKELSQGKLHGIVDYTEDPLVSSDILGNPHSGIVDGLSTKVLGGNLVKLVVWYDNEWGFSNRMIEVMKRLL